MNTAPIAARAARVTAGFLPTIKDLISLTKPRVTSLVLATAGAGICIAPGEIPVGRAAVMLLGTLLCVGSANALNCYVECHTDFHMARTRERALPSGRLDPNVALAFGLLLGLVSVPMLAVGVNLMTGLLGLLALTSYVGVYTPMKQWSPLALIVGAVPGALPPLMGWTAVTGHLAAYGCVLFGLLFLWQMPHVIGLASFRRDDYVAAGIRVVPAVYGERVVRAYAVAWTLLLIALSLVPTFAGWAGKLYLGAALVLGAMYLAASLGLGRSGLRHDTLSRWGKRLFLTSLLYLPLLYLALIVDGRA